MAWQTAAHLRVSHLMHSSYTVTLPKQTVMNTDWNTPGPLYTFHIVYTSNSRRRSLTVVFFQHPLPPGINVGCTTV